MTCSAVWPGRTSVPSRASRSAAPLVSAARAISPATCWNRSVLATKSVSQLSSTSTPASVPFISAATSPLAAVRVARLVTSLAPFRRRISTAFSMLPSASSRARLQSIIPAPVWSRSRFTSAVVKFAMSLVSLSSCARLCVARPHGARETGGPSGPGGVSGPSRPARTSAAGDPCRACGGPGAVTPPGPADSRTDALFRAFAGLGRADRAHRLALLPLGAVDRAGGPVGGGFVGGGGRGGRLGSRALSLGCGLSGGSLTGGSLSGGALTGGSLSGGTLSGGTLGLGRGPAFGQLPLPLGQRLLGADLAT